MSLKRRDFLRLSGLAAVGVNQLSPRFSQTGFAVLDNLKPMTGDVVPITVEERQARIQKAQRLMAENRIEAVILDSGTSMVYFTGIGWGQSERTMVAIIPAKGEVKYVSPALDRKSVV